MLRLAKVTLSASAIALAGTSIAQAQQAGDNWSRPYGMAHGEEGRPYVGQRGQGANRVVINGIIQAGVGVSARAAATGTGTVAGGVGANGQYLGSSATAIANQLNVVVNGNYNTVVVNSRQINNGNISANTSNNANPPQTGGPVTAGVGTPPSSAPHSPETPQ